MTVASHKTPLSLIIAHALLIEWSKNLYTNKRETTKNFCSQETVAAAKDGSHRV